MIADAIGPVWEANYVWLIFVLVVLWTAFPTGFAQIMPTFIVPLTAVAMGVILRGAAFAFRKSVTDVESARVFGATFAASSVITPFFLGAVAGGIASGRVPARGTGDLVTSWVNPTSMLGGTLAVLTCAYLAAVFLTADAERRDLVGLVAYFRIRALTMAVVAGAAAVTGVFVLRADAPTLYDGLTDRGLGVVVGSVAAGVASIGLLINHRYRRARVAAVLAVVAVIWGWALGQYPDVLVDELTIDQAAGADATLTALMVSLGVGACLFGPALAYLLVLNQRGELDAD